MPLCTRRFEWDACHRIPAHESKCRAFHGHRYAAELTVRGPELDEAGRVVDFGVLKERVGGWIDDHWDHTALLQRGDPDPTSQAVARSNEAYGRPVYWLDRAPTAEVLAAELGRVATELLMGLGIEVASVDLWETPNCRARWPEH